ncbi:HAD-IIIA family hydrolase [Geomonas sp. RF6]|uniref:HAD family hydrolase n=1 Tax=Geomonas sp. RF6 TaxID=2897342 RepID=UPI001E292D30|nr:HAD-IIIA family hydrolase [Geomonas sp. RF6]UFS68989.1 HAD-IIIA family hydrolase [Geomonas sp. RF6]
MIGIKLIIFDLDGTLIHSLPDLIDATNTVRAHFSLPELDAEAVRKLVGQGARSLVQRALPGFPNEAIEEGLSIYIKYNAEHIADKTRLYPGVSETLEQLDQMGVQQAVVSNKNVALCHQVLKQFGVDQYFSAVLGADSLAARKPSPEPVLTLLRHFDVSARQSAIVGDSINDIAAGNGAGIITIGCSYGYGDLSELESAEYVVRDFPAILNLPALKVVK